MKKKHLIQKNIFIGYYIFFTSIIKIKIIYPMKKTLLNLIMINEYLIVILR